MTVAITNRKFRKNLQENKEGVPKMAELTQQQICDQGKSIEQT